jgi:pimeloyl-ACP methyl ester carboxylesterase
MTVERVIAADGTGLALHRVGNSDGPPVVLVPGAFSDHRFWLGTRETGFGRAAGDRGFSVWALDPRGHGASERPGPGSEWSFADWIRHDVPAAVRAATAEGGRAVVVAHSAGGAAALAAAASPETARRISESLRRVRRRPTPGSPPRALAASSVGRARLASARALGLGGEDELGGVMAEWMGWNAAGAWRWPGGPDLLAAIRPAPFPVLIATGSGDRLFAPPAACRDLAAQLGEKAVFREFGRATGCSEDFTHPGLLVSRAAREEVWPVILDWISGVGTA